MKSFLAAISSIYSPTVLTLAALIVFAKILSPKNVCIAQVANERTKAAKVNESGLEQDYL